MNVNPITNNLLIVLPHFDQMEERIVYDKKQDKFITLEKPEERETLYGSADFAKGEELRGIFRNYVETHIEKISPDNLARLYGTLQNRINKVNAPWEGIKGFFLSLFPASTETYLKEITFLRTVEATVLNKMQQLTFPTIVPKTLPAAAPLTAPLVVPASAAPAIVMAPEVVPASAAPAIVSSSAPPPPPVIVKRKFEGEPDTEPSVNLKFDPAEMRDELLRRQADLKLTIRDEIEAILGQRLANREDLLPLIREECTRLLDVAEKTAPEIIPASYTELNRSNNTTLLLSEMGEKLNAALDRLLREPADRPLLQTLREQAISRQISLIQPIFEALFLNEGMKLIESEAKPIQQYLNGLKNALEPIRVSVAKAHDLESQIREKKAALSELENTLEQHHLIHAFLLEAENENRPFVELNIVKGVKKNESEANMPFYNDEAFKRANLDRLAAGREPFSKHNRLHIAIQEHQDKKLKLLEECRTTENEIKDLQKELTQIQGQKNNKIPFKEWERLYTLRLNGPIKKWQTALTSRINFAVGVGEKQRKSTVKPTPQKFQKLYQDHPEQESFDAGLAKNPTLKFYLNEEDNTLIDHLGVPEIEKERLEKLKRELEQEKGEHKK